MNGWHRPEGKEIEKIYRNRLRRNGGKKAKQKNENADEDTVVQRQAREAYQIRQEFVKEFKDSKHSHRAFITAASCYVEWMINYIVNKACKTGKQIVKKQYVPLSSKVVLLYELGVVDTKLYEDIKKLINLRNKAAHNVRFQISKNEFQNFTSFKEADDQTQKNLKKKENAIVDVVEGILVELESRYQDYVCSASQASSN